MRQRATIPLPDRFWSKVAIAGPDDCWLWTAGLAKSGYGMIGVGRPSDRIESSHRIAWTLANGPIPGGLYVLHRCDVRRCCNPAHLFLGTHADNMRDVAEKGRWRTAAREARMARGERHGNAILTDELVREIRRLGELGVRCTEIAASLGLPVSTVWGPLRGKNWTHVN